MAIEEANEAATAADATLVSALQIAADRSHPDEAARNSAWNTIVSLWASGETGELVHALASAQVSPRAFLADLLCQIWSAYLGESPAVLGTYEADHLHPDPHEPVEPFSVIQSLLQSGCVHPDEAAIKASRSLSPQGAWAHLLRPPAVDKWHDLLSASSAEADIVARTNQTVEDVMREAVGSGHDLDWVVAQAIFRAPSGIAGLGQSAEARAYLFCRISSAYTAPDGVLAFVPSPRAQALFAQFRDLPARVGATGYQSMLREQMRPILENVYRPPPAEQPQDGEAAVQPAWRVPDPIPTFWLFLVHWASQAPVETAKRIFDMCTSSFLAAWGAYKDVTVPLAIAAGDTQPAQIIPVPVLTPIFWTIMGYARARADTEKMTPRPARDLGWLLYVRVADMDALMRPHADSLLGKAWTETRLTVLRVVAATLVATHPSKYVGSLESVLERTLDLYTYEEVASKSDNISYHKLWLRFIALCGQPTKAFETVMLEHATLDQARHIFSGMIKLLNPHPTDEEKAVVLELQKTYSEAVYESPEDLPPHLLDRFLGVATGLVRHKTVLAQALLDGGALMLLQAVQTARYPYPDAEDYAPPHVRAMLRARMVEQAYEVLKERMYLAAQAQLVRNAPLLEEGAPPPVPRVTQPRIRRRPSWMATGG